MTTASASRTLRVLVSRGRSSLAILIALGVVATAIDALSSSPDRSMLVAVGGTRLALMLGCLALCRQSLGERVVVAATATGVCVLLCASLVLGVLRSDFQTMLMIVAGLSIASGAFLPWGWRCQLTIVGVAALVAVVLHMQEGHPPLGWQPWTIAGANMAASVWFAAELERTEGLIASYTAAIDASLNQSRRLQVELQDLVEARSRILRVASERLESHCRDIPTTLRPQIADLHGQLEEMGTPVALADNAVSSEARHLVARMLLAAERMDATLGALFGYLELGHASCASARVDLAQTARDHLERLRKRDPGRSVDVEVDDVIEIHGDPVLLSELMQRLIDNAWEFTSERVQGSIRIVGTAGQGAADGFIVRDNGVGLDMAYAERIFRPFERLEREHASAAPEMGLGMGLARARRIVARHGGLLRVRSAPGEGAEFRVRLPAGQAAGEA